MRWPQAAAVVPIALLFAFVVATGNWRGERTRHAVDHAGYVLNARWAEGGVARTLDTEAARSELSVVLLGNSYAHANVDRQVLADQLGVPAGSIVSASLPNSSGPHWYAMLHRLLDRGARPSLVLVVADLGAMLSTDPGSEAMWLNLDRLRLPHAPVLDRLTGAPRSHRWTHASTNRRTLRDTTLDLIARGGARLAAMGGGTRLTWPRSVSLPRAESPPLATDHRPVPLRSIRRAPI